MPAVGDQHRPGQPGYVSKPPPFTTSTSSTSSSVTANPFEEQKPHMSEYTAQEIATLQSRLDKQLGPEYISARPGAGGQKVHYLAAEKCINLANEVFGFNGWSSAIQNIQIDFVDENENTGRISLGLSVIVRVSLRDGTFHEDIGYGHIENCKGKAAAFEKAKKEGTTDALKRALRNFGNVLGNCIYDKEYLAKVTKVKAGPTKWDVANLHRHPDYAPKKEPPPLPQQPVETKPRVIQPEPKGAEPPLPEMPSKVVNHTPPTDPDGEFGSDVFDEADFVEPCAGNPDEIALEIGPGRPLQAPMAQPNPHGNHPHNLRNPPEATTPSKPERGWAGNRQPAPLPQNNAPTPRPNLQQANPQPPKPAPATPAARPPQPIPNQNTRPPQPQHSKSSQDPPQPSPPKRTIDDSGLMGDGSEFGVVDGTVFPEVKLPEDAKLGFFSARAAESLKSNPMALKTAPQFDPRADSPSIRKTAGFNHNLSAPVLRKTISTNPSAITTAVGANTARQSNNNSPLPGREISNPPTDFPRRVGAPPTGFNSPVTRAQSTSSYRPPVRRSANDYGGPGPGNAASPGAGPPPVPVSVPAPAIINNNNPNGKRLPLSDVTNASAASGTTGGASDPKRVKVEQQGANYAQQQQKQ
ncbi:DNA repair protein rad52 [Arachnomyces sp. PD_36]|nr:DNA repair protein rad52 [Arachnomyces sp. PD_36]